MGSQPRCSFAPLASCTSLRHLVLVDNDTRRVHLPPLPPFLYSLNLSACGIEIVELLTYLGEPRSSQLRQLRVSGKLSEWRPPNGAYQPQGDDSRSSDTRGSRCCGSFIHKSYLRQGAQCEGM